MVNIFLSEFLSKVADNVFSLAVRWGNRSTKLSNHH